MRDPHPYEPPPLAHDRAQALGRHADAMEILHVVDLGAGDPSGHVTTERAPIDRRYAATGAPALHVTRRGAADRDRHRHRPRRAPMAGDRRRCGLLPATTWSRTLGAELLELRDHLQRHVEERTPSLAAVRCGDQPPITEE